MKKRILLICTAALACFSIHAQNKFVNVPKTATPITVDGDVDAAWSSAVNIVIDQWGTDKPVPDETDFAASYKLLWDDNNLYFIGTITDDNLLDQAGATDNATPDWEVDNFEIYWSPGNSTLEDMSEMIQVRLPYANAGSEDPTSSTKTGWSDKGFMDKIEFVNAVKKNTDNGYVIEAALDLAKSAEAAGKSVIGMKDTIGFNAIACDNDGTAARENIGGAIKDFTWNQADTMIRLVLSEAANAIVTAKTSVKASVYPNPASKEIRISSVSAVKSFELISLNGQVVLKSVNPSNVISLGAVKSGLYNARITTENGVENQKLMIK